MGVVRAKIQTVEDIYQLLRTAVMQKRPIRAAYDGRERWLCPHRLGRNGQGRLRALCDQYGGQSGSGLEAAGSLANWRCIAVEKLSRVELLEGAWHTAPNHSRPQTCVVTVDVDAEDEPLPRVPQKGQCGRHPSSWRARTIRSVAMEAGLCLSGRTRRATRAEVRRRLWGW